MEMSRGWGLLIGPGPAWAEPEASNLRIVRILLLILLAVLLLPYLVTPFYRTGHPVSALMAWRWLKGAPVSRQWIDFNAISPYLPRSVVGSEDAKFCSHRGVDWDALQDAIDDAEDGELDPRRLDHHPAGGQEPVPVAGPQRGPQRRWNCRWRCGSISCCPSSGSWKSTSTSPNSARPGSSGPRPGRCTRSAIRPRRLSAREAALLAAILPNPVRRSARNPGPGVRRLAGTYMARAKAAATALLERKSCFLSQFSALLTASRPSFTPSHPL